MKARLEFDTEQIFKPEYLEFIHAYLEGKIIAKQAIHLLGWTQEEWNTHLAGIFSVALRDTIGDKAKLTILTSSTDERSTRT